jgi:cyclophilin family peptidyl-prolyl cis-trans isomerase
MLGLGAALSSAGAQDAPPAAVDAPAGGAAAPDSVQARGEFDAKFTAWKETLQQLRTLRHDYQLADEAGRAALEEQWKTKLAEANAMLSEVVAAARRAYAAAPNEDRELTTFLVKMLEDDVARDRYESAAELAAVLLDHGCDQPQVLRNAGIAFFALNDLDRTVALLEKAKSIDMSAEDLTTLRKEVEEYAEFWKREQELRQAEAAADDLPRVKLTTTKGDITVELFENEAPETVGNFVSLVKQGFYNGLTFHRVIGGFMAQAGCPAGDGSGGPGYAIYDECQKPEARKHFRGSLSMAKTAAANSGGSQFFICFRPTAPLNGRHTVFGRVIEGLEVLDKLQRREPSDEKPAEPDRILKAEVLRDRGHEYVPHKVE